VRRSRSWTGVAAQGLKAVPKGPLVVENTTLCLVSGYFSCPVARPIARARPTLVAVTVMIRRLDLRFDASEGRPNAPVVRILVDGEELLAQGDSSSGFVGFDPQQLLLTRALVPTEPPLRVALHQCSCGLAGCGCVAMVIESAGDTIRWTDPRNLVGVYVTPIYDGEGEWEGEPHDFGNIVFDADQYLQEVERATRDRSWETEPLLIGRLLAELLGAARAEFADHGYHLGWVSPWWEDDREFRVEFIGPTGQVIVGLESSAATPEERPQEMAAALENTPPEVWRVTDRSDWPPDVVRQALAARARKLRNE